MGVIRVGAGAWGVESSANPTLPPSHGVAPPPLGCEGGRSARHSGGGGYSWVNGRLLAEQARRFRLWLCCLHSPPRPPPPLPHFPAPDFQTSLSKDVWKSGAGKRRRGEGLCAHHSGGLGGVGFWPPRLYARTWEKLRAEAIEGVKTLVLKWVPNFDDIDVIDAGLPKGPCRTKNMTGSSKITFVSKSWHFEELVFE